MCQNVPELRHDLDSTLFGTRVCPFVCCDSCGMDLVKPSLDIKVVIFNMKI